MYSGGAIISSLICLIASLAKSDRVPEAAEMEGPAGQRNEARSASLWRRQKSRKLSWSLRRALYQRKRAANDRTRRSAGILAPTLRPKLSAVPTPPPRKTLNASSLTPSIVVSEPSRPTSQMWCCPHELGQPVTLILIG